MPFRISSAAADTCVIVNRPSALPTLDFGPLGHRPKSRTPYLGNTHYRPWDDGGVRVCIIQHVYTRQPFVRTYANIGVFFADYPGEPRYPHSSPTPHRSSVPQTPRDRGAYPECLIYYSSNVARLVRTHRGRRLSDDDGAKRLSLCVCVCTNRKFRDIVGIHHRNRSHRHLAGRANKLHGSTAKPDIKQKPHIYIYITISYLLNYRTYLRICRCILPPKQRGQPCKVTIKYAIAVRIEKTGYGAEFVFEPRDLREKRKQTLKTISNLESVSHPTRRKTKKNYLSWPIFLSYRTEKQNV